MHKPCYKRGRVTYIAPLHTRSWTIPSNIAVSGFGGKSLFGLFTASIGEQLAHFPTGPALTDKFW